MWDSDKALVDRARRGQTKALEQLVRRHLGAACAVALAILGSPSDAEDVAQDAFIVAFERLDTCRDPERFAGWLLQIVRNRALNALAQGKLRGTVKERLPPPEAGQEPREVGLKDRLLGALERLSPPQREVVLLHDLQEWTHREIAERLDISEVMSRQHLFTARRALRTHLTEDTPREDRHGK
jgi:RNA polymerase sigma-70 factor (ECF subfamily)